MSTLLIHASGRQAGSTSRQLLAEVRTDLAAAGENIVERDLATTAIPFVDEAWIKANFTAEEDRTDGDRAALALSDSLVAELKGADQIVIALPVYNFSVPAVLKAWIDQVARARVTFKYTENGPVGLLEGKRALIVMVSGGTPAGSDIDFASAYLRHILGFIGITDVTLAAADRIMADADAAVERARTGIDAWLGDQRAAA